MRQVSSSDARNNLSAILAGSLDEPILIQKHGHNEAVLLSWEAYQKLINGTAHEFQLICDKIAKNAKVRGLTDEKFAEIMAEEEQDE